MVGNTDISDTVISREEMLRTFALGSCNYIGDDNRLLMKELIRHNLLLLYSSMGAMLGKDCDGFLFLKYWKRKNVLNKYSQVIMRKPIIYLSGFCSRNRGLHWNR